MNRATMIENVDSKFGQPWKKVFIYCFGAMILLVMSCSGLSSGDGYLGDWGKEGWDGAEYTMTISKEGKNFIITVKSFRGSNKYSGSLEDGKIVMDNPGAGTLVLTEDGTTILGGGGEWRKGGMY